MQLLSNAVRSQGTGDGAAYWNADSFGADHYSECKITTANDGGPAVRCSDSGCYYLGGGSGSNAIWKYVSPSSWSQVGSALNFSYSGTDVIRIEATGTSTTSIKVYKNGVQQGSTVTDSSSPLTSGAAGVYSAGATILDDWQGGDVSSAPTVNVAEGSTTLAETVTALVSELRLQGADSATIAEAVTAQVVALSLNLTAQQVGALIRLTWV